MYRRFMVVMPVLASLTAFPALAQQQTNSSTIFDSWIMGCASQTDKTSKTVKGCEIRSTLILQDEKTGQQGVAAVIAIGRPMTEKALQAVAQVPLAAQLNILVRVVGADDKPVFELVFAACQPQMCSAVASLNEMQVGALKKVGDKLFIVYRNQAGQDIRLDVSTKGLPLALETLLREK